MPTTQAAQATLTVTAPAAAAAPAQETAQVFRDDQRTEYLLSRTSSGTEVHYALLSKHMPSEYAHRMSVWRSHREGSRAAEVIVSICSGGFNCQHNYTPAEARRIARALAMAADEAELAGAEADRAAA